MAQKWAFQADGTIRNQGKCLDIAAANMSNGTELQLWTCNGIDAQRFTVQGNQIKSVASGRCVNVAGNNSANGTQLQMWDCDSAANQRWNVPA